MTKNTIEACDVRQVAVEHLARIEEKITQLEDMRETLSTLVHACHGDNRPDCPILSDLATGQH